MATKEIIHDSFTIERRYRSPVDKVWNAFADETLKRAWFAEGEGFEVIEYGLDFRVGGREHARFVSAYSMSNDGTPFSASLVTVTFEPDENGGTRVTHLEQVVFLDQADGVAMRETGTRSLYEALAEHLGEEAVPRSEIWKA